MRDLIANLEIALCLSVVGIFILKPRHMTLSHQFVELTFVLITKHFHLGCKLIAANFGVVSAARFIG